MESKLSDYGLFLGRILLGHIFLLSGVKKIFAWSGTAAYMASHGIVAAHFFLLVAVLLELAGALSLLIGFRCRVGALLLVLFLVPVTLVFHSFWALGEPEQGKQMIQFMKNVSIIGGLLFVASSYPGAFSIDARGKTTPGSQPV